MAKYKAQSFVCDIYLNETLRQKNVFAEHIKGSQYNILGQVVTLKSTTVKHKFYYDYINKTGLHRYTIIKKLCPLSDKGEQYDN